MNATLISLLTIQYCDFILCFIEYIFLIKNMYVIIDDEYWFIAQDSYFYLLTTSIQLQLSLPYGREREQEEVTT
jgi:hypothetical protein